VSEATEPGLSPAQEQARELARAAVEAAADKQYLTVALLLSMISLATGPHGVSEALIAWCDWNLELQRQLDGRTRPQGPVTVIPAWENPETGQLCLDAAAMPPDERWAGQLVAARAAGDLDNFNALLSAMPDDGYERGRYALVLLMSCAGYLRLVRESAS
jgi:hypothetical protein